MKRLLAALALVLAVSGCSSTAESFVSPLTPATSPQPTLSSSPAAVAWPTPIARYTPGAVEACTLPRPKSERDVTAATRRQVLANYHYTGPTDAQHIEIDHRVPFALCGTNDARNLWVEPVDPGTVSKGFTLNSKDALESYVSRQVRAGRWTLAEGQRVFFGDWRVGYCMFLKPATYEACLREVQGK